RATRPSLHPTPSSQRPSAPGGCPAAGGPRSAGAPGNAADTRSPQRNARSSCLRAARFRSLASWTASPRSCSLLLCELRSMVDSTARALSLCLLCLVLLHPVRDVADRVVEPRARVAAGALRARPFGERLRLVRVLRYAPASGVELAEGEAVISAFDVAG